jgi:CHAT domain-containing protein
MKSLLGAAVLVLLAASASAQNLPAGPLVEAVVNALLRDHMLAVRDVAATPPPGVPWFDLNTWVDAYRCISISRYEWSVHEQSADTASVDVRIYGTGFSAGNPRVEEVLPVHWRLGLVQHDGVWKIASAGTLEAALAPELAASPNDETFRRLLTDPRVDPDRLLLQVALQKNPAGDTWALRRAKGFSPDPILVEMLINFDADKEAAGGTEPWRQAVEIAYASGDHDLIALAHLHAGIDIWQTNDIPAALEHFRKAAALMETVRDPRAPLRALHLDSLIASRSGQYTSAIRDAQTVMQNARRFQWPAGVCGAFFLLSVVHDTLRNDEVSTRYNDEALRCSEERGHNAQIAHALTNRANEMLKDDPEADVTAILRRALALAPGWLQDGSIASIHSSLGARLLPGKEGEEHLQTAVRLASSSKEIGAWISALMRLSDWHYREGRFEESLRYADEAARASGETPGRARTTGSEGTYWEILAARARAFRALGDDAGAERELRAAIALIEQRRGEAPVNGTILSNVFERNVSPYQELAALLVDANRIREAVAVSDAVKARTLRDLLASADVDLARRMTEEERAEERRLEEEVERVNTAMMKEQAGTEVYAGLEGRRQGARQLLEQFRVELSMRRPGLRVRAATAHEDPLQSRAVIESDLILDYLVADKRTTLFIIRRGQAEAHVIPIGRKELEKRVASLLSLIESRDVRYAREAKDLYQLLLGPAERLLTASATACIIPDGPLWSVPFHALRDSGGKYVIERTAVYYGPSLGALQSAAPRQTAATVLAIGNPTLAMATKERATSVIRNASLGRLPHAEHEVAAIGKMYGAGSKVLIGANARESAAKAEAGNYDILHFAAHAIADNRQPLYSGVVLAAAANDGEDGILEARELLDLDLRADLVVLAACSTGAGRFRAGEGVVGLAWAFLVAGCPRTIVTKWEVNSASTSQVMVDFHRRLRAGDSAPVALRAAQLRLMRDERYAHPVDWAPFIALGAP